MAKFQIAQNSNHYDQNVGEVLISMEMVLKKYESPFLVKVSLILFFLNFGTQGGVPLVAPYLSLIHI